MVADTGIAVWNRTIKVLADSLYGYASGRHQDGHLMAISLARGIYLQMDMVPAGDSTRMAVQGRHYVGDSSRPGRISARAEDWAPITAADDSRDALRRIAEALSVRDQPFFVGVPTEVLVPDVRMSADSLLIELPGGRRGFCRANYSRRDDWVIVDKIEKTDWCPLPAYDRARMSYNTYVLENPHEKPVGATMNACVHTGVPTGWVDVEWYTDPAHCPYDSADKYKSDPNMVRIRRVR